MSESLFLLTAGLGTRLKPITDDRPKPLLPVLGQSILERLLRALPLFRFQTVTCNGFHHADQLKREIESLSETFQKPISILVETPEILGTGGGVRNAVDRLQLKETLVVINGDIQVMDPMEPIFDRHRSSGCEATMVLAPAGDRALERFDVSDGRVVRSEQGPYLFAGISMIAPALFPRLPRPGCLYRGFFKPLIDEGRVAATVLRDRWSDLGTPLAYYQGVQHELARLQASAFAHPLATLSPGVELREGAVVERGARVGAGVVLRRVLIGPDTEIGPHQVIENQIIFGNSKVSLEAEKRNV